MAAEEAWPRAVEEAEGVCQVELETGEVFLDEVHWYEAYGTGRRDLKIQRFSTDQQ